MRWSFPIARVSGIDIRIHVTFFLVVIWGASQFASYGMRGMLFGIALILALFLCVTLHELGHSVVAQGFGVKVRQIVLLPIGGVAMMQRIPRDPWQELWIALAGPVVNVVIAVALAIGVFGKSLVAGVNFTELLSPARAGPSGALFIRWLMNVNVVLVIFNMIPAFPLDGGRVLRAILAMRVHHQRATAIAATVGQVLAVLLGMAGLLTSNFMLVLVAAFIFFGAGAENLEGRARAVLSGRRVGDAYNRNALILHSQDPLAKVVNHILTSYQPDFAVMEGHRLLGVLTRGDVVSSLAQGADNATVGQLMHRDPLRVDADQSLEEVREKMNDSEKRIAAVFNGPMFLGLVSSEDIEEAYALLQFTNGQSRGPATSGVEDGGVVV